MGENLPVLRNAVLAVPFVFLLFSLPLAAQSKPASAQPPAKSVESAEGVRGQKLILKDGTYLLISKYQIVGDRVRYYSVERSEWEEIPSSLVNWPATRKAAGAPNATEKKAMRLARDVDIEAHPEQYDVGPGLGLPIGVLLPPGQGMFAYNGGSILKLTTDLAKLNLNKGRFLATLVVPVPVLAKTYTVSLAGKHAKTRIASPEPVFFYRTSSRLRPHFRLIQAVIHGKRRNIEVRSVYFGAKQTKADEIPTTMHQVENDTYRITADQDLSPGEYVLAEVDPGRGIDMYVWDFGIAGPHAKPQGKKHKKK